MTQKDKELLLKDLSARLPYNVIVEYGVKHEGRDLGEKKGKLTGRMLDSYFYNITVGLSQVYSIKPYLRPMSSMTEEERIKIQLLCDGVEIDDEGNCFHYTTIYSFVESFKNVDFDAIDWLLAHHFDFRGLIPLGLAIEVTEENNPYKDKL